MHENSIFKQVIELSPEKKNREFFKHKVALLHQFIGKQNKTEKHGSIEKELEEILLNDYEKYKALRENLLEIKEIYGKASFTNHRINLIDALGVRICPYCNRQYINVFERENDSIAIAELDHFYPKADFPLYALSLYNFVPSCAKCNQLKSNKLDAYLYPYCDNAEEENRKPHFEIKYQNLDGMRGKTAEIDILVRKDLESEKLANAETLHHEGLYKNHKNDVRRLLRAQRLDNANYRQGINNFFRDYKLTEGDLKEMLYGL